MGSWIDYDYGADNILANIVRLGLFKTRRTKFFWRQQEYIDRVTKLIPRGKLGEADQVAEVLGPSLSATSYINAATLNISGGLPISRI